MNLVLIDVRGKVILSLNYAIKNKQKIEMKI